jgi:effector-binding domain-containing protein
MKALRYILFLLLIVIIGFSMYVAVQPNTYSFSISKVIKAPDNLISEKLAKINDKSHVFYTNTPETEVNIVSVSNSSQKTNTALKQEVVFKVPSNVLSELEWSFYRLPEGTKVQLQIEGKLDFKSKLRALFQSSIVRQVKPFFEKQLIKLERELQDEMSQYSITVEGTTQHSGGFYLYKTSATRIANFEKKRDELFGEIGSYAIANNISMAGKPFVIFHTINDQNDSLMFSCAIPTNSRIISNDTEILTGKLDTFRASKTILKGDYKNLKEAWDRTLQYAINNGLELEENGVRLEVYLTDKNDSENPADLVTELFVEIKQEVLINK